MFPRGIDILITSFPQTWGHAYNKDKAYDLLETFVEYIRSQREGPLMSVEDLALAILTKCSTVFTSDRELLWPDQSLLDIYQDAIGEAVSIAHI